MLALTGDLDFIKSLSSRASELDMYLNEYGLWRWQDYGEDNETGERASIADAKGYWTFITGESEKGIMTELGKIGRAHV